MKPRDGAIIRETVFREDNILQWQGAYLEHATNDYKAVASELRRIL
jgi:hypothetical protein